MTLCLRHPLPLLTAADDAKLTHQLSKTSRAFCPTSKTELGHMCKRRGYLEAKR